LLSICGKADATGESVIDSSPDALRRKNRMLVAAAACLLCLATALVLGLLWQSYQRYHVVAEASVENTTLSLERFLGAHF
jgi:hypothetical protein